MTIREVDYHFPLPVCVHCPLWPPIENIRGANISTTISIIMVIAVATEINHSAISIVLDSSSPIFFIVELEIVLPIVMLEGVALLLVLGQAVHQVVC